MSIRSPYGILKKMDPLRSALLNGVFFILVLLAGGLWAFQSMTRREIAAGAAIFAVVDAAVCLLQLLSPQLLLPLSFPVTLLQSWTAIPTSALFQLTGHLPVSAFLACLSPFLFVPFEKQSP